MNLFLRFYHFFFNNMISKVLHVLNPLLIFSYTYDMSCKRYVMLRNTILFVTYLLKEIWANCSVIKTENT